MDQTRPELNAGTLVDERYQVERVLGHGGFATVYTARDTATDTRVAIKVLHDYGDVTGMSRVRFEREIEAVSQLRDPHVVRLLGHGETHAQRYIVFEYVPGVDLHDAIAQNAPLAPSVVRRVLSQLLGVLREAHNVGVLHRDIKPANIRVDEAAPEPWTVKLLDFGIARFTDPTEARATKTGVLLGTPRYMSPEQLLGEPLSPATDIYALGIVAHEMLVGSEAIHGTHLGDQLERLQSGYYFADTAAHDTQLTAVIARMTARKADQRFQNADAVLRALGHAQPTPDQPTLSARPTPSLVPYFVVTGVLLVIVGVLIGALLQRSVPPADVPPRAAFVARRAVVEQPPMPAPEPDKEPTRALSGCERNVTWRGNRVLDLPTSSPLDRGRSAYVYLPESYENGKKHAVVAVFHTQGRTRDVAVRESDIQRVAEDGGFIVLSLDRHDELGVWAPRDMDAVGEALQTVAANVCVDPGRIFALGHGTGTAFVRELACRARLAGIALVGDVALVGEPRCEISPPVPVIRFAGRSDPYVPIAGGQSCLNVAVVGKKDIERDWRAQNGCSSRSRSWSDADGCSTWDCSAAVVSCEFDGGHGWPLTKPFTFFTCVNGATQFPIMDVSWKFFSAQPPLELK